VRAILAVGAEKTSKRPPKQLSLREKLIPIYVDVQGPRQMYQSIFDSLFAPMTVGKEDSVGCGLFFTTTQAAVDFRLANVVTTMELVGYQAAILLQHPLNQNLFLPFSPVWQPKYYIH